MKIKPFVWNALLSTTRNPKYAYMHIINNRIIVTNGKVAVVKKVTGNLGEDQHFYLPLKLLQVSLEPVTLTLEEDSKLFIQYGKEKKKSIWYKTRVDNFPSVKKLEQREQEQMDEKLTVAISRSTLMQILAASSSAVLHLTVHEKSKVGKWEGANEIGFFSHIVEED